MNPNDAIVTALTFWTPFNPHNRVYRSVKVLAQFAGITEEEVMDRLVGDLSELVVCKPSAQKGVLVALAANVEPANPVPQPEDSQPEEPEQADLDGPANEAVQDEAGGFAVLLPDPDA